MLNQLLPVCIVIPLTTKIKRYKGNPILTPTKLNGLQTESEMLVFHVRSISKDRLVRKVGSIQRDELERALATLHDILRL